MKITKKESDYLHKKLLKERTVVSSGAGAYHEGVNAQYITSGLDDLEELVLYLRIENKTCS